MTSIRAARPGRDSGSATVWVLGAGLLVTTLGLTCVLAVSATAARHRAQAAADLAALAGARYAALGPATACAQAATVVRDNGATLTGCHLDGLDLVVDVSVPVAGAPAGLDTATATARAGPVTIQPPPVHPRPPVPPRPPPVRPQSKPPPVRPPSAVPPPPPRARR